MDSTAICLTCGEQSENHVGMKINGNGLAKEGYKIIDLILYKQKLEALNITCELLNLDTNLDEEQRVDVIPASILIIRNGVDHFIGDEYTLKEFWNELSAFEWDKKYWDTRRKKVLNKHARYNVCFGDKSQEPNYEEKKGTIIAYDSTPILKQWRTNIGKVLGANATNLEVEGNYYYDIKKCGIGFHGDSERKKIIAASLGGTRPIHWQWYYQSKPIGPRIKVELTNGDMYIMSEKASGWDWKLRSKKTLRHAAGEKYVK